MGSAVAILLTHGWTIEECCVKMNDPLVPGGAILLAAWVKNRWSPRNDKRLQQVAL